MVEDFGCGRFIFCSDAGPASDDNRLFSHTGKWGFIVTQSIKKLAAELKHKKTGKNPNDPAGFIDRQAVTKDGDRADILYYLDEAKIAEEARYDGLYAVCTDLFDDLPGDILRVSEGRWQIEACFRIMKTDFGARPMYVQREERIKAHFLICFLSLLVYRLLEKKLEKKYTCSEILETLRKFQFADVGGQGFMPLYKRTMLTDTLHCISGIAPDASGVQKQMVRK